MKELEYDFLAVGGGTAGLVATAGAAYLGLRPGLVEREALGGDCLWTGCVPSKALIASARLAHAMRNAEDLGLTGVAPSHAFSAIMDRMRQARGRVAEHDDPERFRKLGVDVHFGEARFQSPGTLEVEGIGRIRSRRILLATGAAPAVPPIQGLEEAGYLTHTSAFHEDHLPESMLILGAGPVGLEFAQVYNRLGSRVTVVEMLPRILPREDPDVASTLQGILEEEGISFVLGASAVQVRVQNGMKSLTLENDTRVEAREIFVATGRTPRTRILELDRGSVETTDGAVRVDQALKTTAEGVWAAGDVTGGPQFTHVADYMARTVLRNSIFPFKKRVSYDIIPRVTYTDPEVAQVGLNRRESEERGGRVHTYPFRDLDRAIVDGHTEGFVRIQADRRGRIQGATILGHSAGELLMPVVLAMKHGISLGKVSDTIFPYPTRAEGVKRAADAFQRTRLDGPGGLILKKIVSWLK